MKNKNTKTVGLEILLPHPTNIETYKVSNVDGLAESITEIGLRYHPIVNNEMEVLSGWRRILALKQLGITEVDVEIVDLPKEAESTFIVYSNTQRQKSEVEIYKEGKLLKEAWGKQQGQRTDLTPELSEEQKLPTRKRISEAVGKTESTYHRIETVGNSDIKMLELVDKGLISLNEAYQACISDKPKHEKDVEEIDLCEIKQCEFCGNIPARIIESENGDLTYKTK